MPPDVTDTDAVLEDLDDEGECSGRGSQNGKIVSADDVCDAWVKWKLLGRT